MKNVLEFLEGTVSKYPERYAVEDENICFTWRELQEYARKIGSFLCKEGKAGSPVAIVAEKGVFTLAAMLGAAYAGDFYVMIDPSQPDGRMREIFEVLRPELTIVLDEAQQEDIRKIEYNGKIYLLREMLDVPVAQNALDVRRCESSAEDILYGIFTSGSTGKPKCVVVSHRAVIDFITHFIETFGFSSGDKIGNQAPFDFDVSVKDIYTSLATGAELVIIPRHLFSTPSLLLDYICYRKVTVLIWAASALGLLAVLKGLEYKVPTEIKKIFFSGEVMPVKLLRIWQCALPGTEFVNLYGPTEITCNCTYYPVERVYEDGEKLPIGMPFEGRKVFLLDENMQIVTEPEKKGEICVARESLALGYYRNREETDKHFKIWQAGEKSFRYYRTGDLGYRGADGNLYFAGRKDFQIKHMGHRIELEEIEARIEQVEGVRKCCCILDRRKNRLKAFYLGEADQKPIREHLKKVLPSYMIPHSIQKTEKIPLNKNGKTDRRYFMELEVGT